MRVNKLLCMKKILIHFFALLSGSIGFAQKNNTDSLLLLLNNHEQEDSVKLNILTNISYAYYEVHPDEGIAFADKAITLAQKLLLPEKLANAYYYKGMCLGTKGIYNDALDLFNQALKIYKTIYTTKKIWDVNNSMAIIYMNLSDYEKALDIYFKNIIAAEQMKDEKKVALTAANISLLYTRIEKPDNALQYNQKAINIYKKVNDNNALANAYASRGNIYDDMNQPSDAINSYREGLLISEPVNYEMGIANNAGNMGSVYSEIKKYDSAFYCTKRALDIYSAIGYKRNISILYGYLGDIILASSDSALLKEDIQPSKKFTVALDYYNKAKDVQKENGNKLEEAESWQQISNVYKLQKNYEQAYYAYEKYSTLKDSTLNENKNKALEKLSNQYEMQKKQIQ